MVPLPCGDPCGGSIRGNHGGSKGSVPGGDLLRVLRRQRSSAHAPGTAGDLFDDHPRDAAKGFAFHRQRRVGDALDHRLLLCRREQTFQCANGDQWHLDTPYWEATVAEARVAWNCRKAAVLARESAVVSRAGSLRVRRRALRKIEASLGGKP